MEQFDDYSSLRFSFENCDILFIPKEDFKVINFCNIVENFISEYNDKGIFQKYKIAKDILLVLKLQADKRYCPYDIKEYETTVFKRLEMGDIVSIDLVNNKDEVIEEFYVDYNGNEININQSSRINEWNYFEVSIASKGV